VLRAIQTLQPPVCCYVYDRQVLLQRVRALRAALPAGARLAYAMKANGHPDVVRALAEVVDGIEVASGGELAGAVAAGAKSLYFAGPAKTDAELAAAVRAGATINVESLHELRRLQWAAATPVRVALRVNRAHASLPASIRMTGVPTPFGLDEAQLGAAFAILAESPHLRFVGFHLHAVSNNLDGPAHARFVEDARQWARQTATAFRVRAEHVNVGGGFGLDYQGTDTFDLSPLGALDGVGLVFEPGRFIAAPAGWYAAEVLDVKRTHGRWFAVVRGGTHHFRLPASWGYSHPFTVVPVDAWPYPFERPGVAGSPVDVVGELCNPRDVLARAQPVAAVRAGDVLVFANTGAYGWEVAHRDFLAHPYPARIVL
jgi:2-[(L-alanin-3-ylcarbamoyl)methyl]-2-hydroxybutanedioate decarboxylase